MYLLNSTIILLLHFPVFKGMQNKIWFNIFQLILIMTNDKIFVWVKCKPPLHWIQNQRPTASSCIQTNVSRNTKLYNTFITNHIQPTRIVNSMRPKRNLLLFPVTRPTRQKMCRLSKFYGLKKIYNFFFFFSFFWSSQSLSIRCKYVIIPYQRSKYRGAKGF